MLTKYPLFRLFLFYAFGVLISGYNLLAADARFLLAVFAIVLIILFWIVLKNDFKTLKSSAPAWYILFFVGGFLNTSVRDSIQQFESSKYYYLEVLERPIEKQKSYSGKAKILSNSNQSFKPTYTLVYFEKSASVKQLLPGDRIEVHSVPSEIEGPKNPNEFDYKSYLELLNIHSRFYLKEGEWLIVKQGSGMQRVSSKIQYYFSQVIEHFGFPAEETAVLQALLIGNRFALSDELSASYASAGAMHVLAVSGLHVGILLLVLLNVSKPILHLRNGKFVQLAIVIIGIWSYAFITGLSPSVLRAATLFTFIYLGRFAKRDVGIYNALLASAFFLLLLQPNLIFQVGFQLSYAAVLGILYLQPKFYNLISKPKNIILDNAWAITCVSFAAQLATFPFSIYYFHQFPLLFLFSNLIVIVVTYGIMVFGLLFLLLGSIGVFIPVLYNPLYYLVWVMNYVVQLIQDIPNSVVYELSIDRIELVLLYAIITLMSVGLARKNFRFMSASLLCLLVLSVFNVYENKRIDQTSELTFYSVGKNTALGYRKGKEVVLFADSSFLANDSKMQFHVLHHTWNQNLKGLKTIKLESDNVHGANEVYRHKTVFLDGFTVKIVDKNYSGAVFNPNEVVLLASNHSLVKGAKQVIASANVSAQIKEEWQEHYQGDFIDLNQGYYSISLKND